MKYINQYPQSIQDQIQALIDKGKLTDYLKNKYPKENKYKTDKALNYPITSMTDVDCTSKLRSVVRSCMHPYQGNWVAIGCPGVYYNQAARTIRTGIEFRHCVCMCQTMCRHQM